MNQVKFNKVSTFRAGRMLGKTMYVNATMYRELMLLTMPKKWLKLHGYYD